MTCSIGDLPDELLFYIFNLLPEEDLVSVCSVCKRWQDCASVGIDKQISDLVSFKSILVAEKKEYDKTTKALTASHIEANPLASSLDDLSDDLKISTWLKKRNHLLNSLFEEFSRDAYNHPNRPLQGSRGGVLASLKIPPSLETIYSSYLEKLISHAFLKESAFELNGSHRAISGIFLRTFLNVLSDKQWHGKTISLHLRDFKINPKEFYELKRRLSGLQVNLFLCLMRCGIKGPETKSLLTAAGLSTKKITLIVN